MNWKFNYVYLITDLSSVIRVNISELTYINLRSVKCYYSILDQKYKRNFKSYSSLSK